MDNPYASNSDESNLSLNAVAMTNPADLPALQIIAGALMSGIVFFAIIVMVMTQGKFDGNIGILTIAGLAFAGLATINHVVVPKFIVTMQLRQAASSLTTETATEDKVRKVTGIYRTGMIIALAMLEGAGFLNLIALMLEHHVASLAATGFLFLLMLVRFPTRNRVEWWVANEIRKLNSGIS